MVDFKSSYADVNGIRLHYISVGQGELIMFVHGFPEFWGAWENQLVELGKDYQAVALDMRGYNLSEKPGDVEAYHVKHLIEDLRALAEHLGHQKFTLVAHDWGGAVAWAAAMRYPDWVEKLIIINSPHPAVFARELLSNPDQQEASRYMLLFRSSKAEDVLSADNYARLMDMVTCNGSTFRGSGFSAAAARKNGRSNRKRN
ncbi:MAG: alpha/beta hydrolase [bacterium]|nr:alpha/beta hydrolase [bacterium]